MKMPRAIGDAAACLTSATDEGLHEAAVAFARSLSPIDRARLGR